MVPKKKKKERDTQLRKYGQDLYGKNQKKFR